MVLLIVLVLFYTYFCCFCVSADFCLLVFYSLLRVHEMQFLLYEVDRHLGVGCCHCWYHCWLIDYWCCCCGLLFRIVLLLLLFLTVMGSRHIVELCLLHFRNVMCRNKTISSQCTVVFWILLPKFDTGNSTFIYWNHWKTKKFHRQQEYSHACL